jgi:thiamine-phosphate pyrophosphorylase
MSTQVFRIVDSNGNRIAEGLRFLEDIARFLLNDENLSISIKELRHNLVRHLSKFEITLLSNRDAEEDVGASTDFIDTATIISLIRSNSKRVEEALRVVEELSKLPDLRVLFNSNEFKKARFNLYSLEKILVAKTSRKETASRLRGLYAILDTGILEKRDKLEAAYSAINGGAKIIQLRDKQNDKSRLLVLAKQLKVLCSKYNVLFIVNDHIDIAFAADADGLHLGQNDMPLEVARDILPIDKIIGCSVEGLSQALQAHKDGADYIALGAIFQTSTKEKVAITGVKELERIRAEISMPIVAIGGINLANVSDVIRAGADSIAAVSSIFNQKNIELATKQMVNKIEEESKYFQGIIKNS